MSDVRDPARLFEQIVAEAAPDDPRLLLRLGEVADTLIPAREAEGRFWIEAARNVTRTLLLHVATPPNFEGRRTLATLCGLVRDDEDAGLAFAAGNPAQGGIVQRQAEAWRQRREESPQTWASVRQTVAHHLGRSVPLGPAGS